MGSLVVVALKCLYRCCPLQTGNLTYVPTSVVDPGFFRVILFSFGLLVCNARPIYIYIYVYIYIYIYIYITLRGWYLLSSKRPPWVYSRYTGVRYASLKSSRIVTKFYRITIVFASYYDRIRVVLRSYLGRITIVFRSNYDRKLDLVRP